MDGDNVEKAAETLDEGRGRLRRGLLALVGGIFAAGALKARDAEAKVNATLNTGSDTAYGLASSVGASNPLIPTLGETNHAVIGSQSVLAVAPMGSGVLGARNGSGLAGVLGVNGSTGFGLFGVSASGVGAQAESDSGLGMRALSKTGVGVQGFSKSKIGVVAITRADDQPALHALSQAKNTRMAALFTGSVRVKGDFSVTGAKAAAVEMTDGSLATMYCQESPEPYFEDFGRAQLKNGAARVAIESEFATLVRRDNVMVFLTPEGDCNGLYVSARDEGGFEVRELRGGTGNVAFSYRLVARRKDIEGERLARIDMPDESHVASLDDDAPARQRTVAMRSGSDDDFVLPRG